MIALIGQRGVVFAGEVGADPQRHDPDVLGDAADPGPVVAGRADDARGVDAVAAGDQVAVGRIAVLSRGFRRLRRRSPSRGRRRCSHRGRRRPRCRGSRRGWSTRPGRGRGCRHGSRCRCRRRRRSGVPTVRSQAGSDVDVVAGFRAASPAIVAPVLSRPHCWAKSGSFGIASTWRISVRFGDRDGRVGFEDRRRRRDPAGVGFDQLEARIAEFGGGGDPGVPRGRRPVRRGRCPASHWTITRVLEAAGEPVDGAA